MIRVLHLIKALGRGGAEVLLSQGLAVADRERFELSYGYLKDRPDEIAADLRAQGVHVDCFNFSGNVGMLLGIRRVARYLRDQETHLVHAHLPMAGVVARAAGQMTGVPVVYTEHALQDRYHPIVRRLNLWTWRWQDRVIAISDDVAESIRKQAGTAIPIQLIRNGVNIETFSPARFGGAPVRAELKIAPEQVLIGNVTSFRKTSAKRIDVWIQTAQIIHEAEPRSRFLLVGDGPRRQEMERLAEHHGVREVLRFVGHQPDVRPYLAAMDVFLVTSAYEGLPIAPLEALAMEIPLVATDAPGLRNIVRHGKTGLLGSSGDDIANTMGHLVLDLVRDPEKRKKLGVCGRELVSDRFNIVRMQRELETAYEDVLADRSKGSKQVSVK